MMPSFTELTAQFNLLDWMFISWMIFSILLATLRGFIAEVLSLLGWVFAFFLAGFYGDKLGAQIPLAVQNDEASYILGFIGIFIGTMIIWTMIRTILRFATDRGFMDNFLGMLFGFVRGLLVTVAVVGGVSIILPLPPQQWWKEAYFHDFLQNATLEFKVLLPTQWSSKMQLDAASLPSKIPSTPSSTPSNAEPSTAPTTLPSLVNIPAKDKGVNLNENKGVTPKQEISDKAIKPTQESKIAPTTRPAVVKQTTPPSPPTPTTTPTRPKSVIY